MNSKEFRIVTVEQDLIRENKVLWPPGKEVFEGNYAQSEIAGDGEEGRKS